MPTLNAGVLTDFTARLFEAASVPAADAATVAASLVGANLRGHDSHGVMRAPQYLDFLARGDYRAGIELIIEKESPAIVVSDGGWGLGQVQAHRLLDRVLPRARSIGLASGTGRRFGHIGRLGEYAERAAAEGLVLIATVNNDGAGQRVAPPGGRGGRLGTNPLCVGVPTGAGAGAPPVVLDFGTSVVAEGKVRVFHINGKPVPDGWLLDDQGRPTNDPGVLYNAPLGSILPMGGSQAYKGFGLGLVLDMLSGGLSGGNCSFPGAPAARGNNVFFLALNPEFFAGSECLIGKASGLAEFVRSTPRIREDESILLPGDPERRVLDSRAARGIPLEDAHWTKLAEAASRLGVAIPEFPSDIPT